MRAFVTGPAGQDGHYLLTQLGERGYETHALYRGQDEVRFDALKAAHAGVTWHRGDITDAGSTTAAIKAAKPDAVFNMAALSFVGASWTAPSLYMETNVNGFINVLEACRTHAPEAHIVQASSSEMYGNAVEDVANEDSRMVPASPYGVSKLAAHHLCKVYRDSYGMRVSSAISFNHESPHRAPVFVTRKIAMAAASDELLTLGNITSRRDWGYAADFTRGFILMAEKDLADDYVLATGETHAIGEFVQAAYREAGRDMPLVRVDGQYQRPNDLIYLRGDATKARSELGWQPSVDFAGLVQLMVRAEMKAVPA